MLNILQFTIILLRSSVRDKCAADNLLYLFDRVFVPKDRFTVVRLTIEYCRATYEIRDHYKSTIL